MEPKDKYIDEYIKQRFPDLQISDQIRNAISGTTDFALYAAYRAFIDFGRSLLPFSRKE